MQKTSLPAWAVRAVRPDVPPVIADAIDPCLARVRTDRWPDGETLAHHLEQPRGRSRAPPRVRTCVRTTLPLGTRVTSAATVALSAVGMMTVLAQGELIDAIIVSQVLAIPIVGLSVAYDAVRLGQSGLARLDVVRAGHDHATVARALLEEAHEQALEADTREDAQRRRDASWYGSLGTAKSAAALWLASTELPDPVTIAAALIAVLIPTVTVLKVWHLLRPGPGRWPRLVRGSLGKRIMGLMHRFAGVRATRDANWLTSPPSPESSSVTCSTALLLKILLSAPARRRSPPQSTPCD